MVKSKESDLARQIRPSLSASLILYTKALNSKFTERNSCTQQVVLAAVFLEKNALVHAPGTMYYNG